MNSKFSSDLSNLTHRVIQEHLSSQFVLQAIEESRPVVQISRKWNLSTKDDFVDIITGLYNSHFFFDDDSAVCYMDDGMIIIYSIFASSRITVHFYGPKDWVEGEVKKFDSKLVRFSEDSTVDWYYPSDSGGGLESSTFTIKERLAHTEFYPWLRKPLDKYIQDYVESDASVLILIGPPGTGKTSFLTHMLRTTKEAAIVAYDKDVLSKDQIFVDFFTSDDMFMIIEDSDTFIQPRTDGNDVMQKFLNLSDGIISTKDKKIVFTTNLPSIASIDEALLRPGRCFDVVHFRGLYRDEAQAVLNKLGIDKDAPDGETSLADLLKVKASGNTPAYKMGF